MESTGPEYIEGTHYMFSHEEYVSNQRCNSMRINQQDIITGHK